MKAFVIDKYGTNEVVRSQNVEVPVIGDNDVLIQVHAASVNPLDIRIRDGKLKQILPFKLPIVLGNDLSGVVADVGSAVTAQRKGDKVYARTDTKRIGSFAEYVVVDSSNVALKPKNLSMEEAAAIPLVGLTCWQILVERAVIKKGSKVLIHGGSGGVGTFAIQLAKYLGASVATTTSKDSYDFVKKLGADSVIDYRTEDFEKVIEGYDFVLDTRGGQTLEKSLNVLKKGGKVISISGPPDKEFAKDFGLKSLLQSAMYLLSYKINRKAKKLGVSYSFYFMKPSGEQLIVLRTLLEKGIIVPVIDKVYPFESTKEALEYSESGRPRGKIVIKVV